MPGQVQRRDQIYGKINRVLKQEDGSAKQCVYISGVDSADEQDRKQGDGVRIGRAAKVIGLLDEKHKHGLKSGHIQKTGEHIVWAGYDVPRRRKKLVVCNNDNYRNRHAHRKS